jgi:hypothetical protein
MMETREEKKFKAGLRAELRLRQAFERIDFEEDVLKPKVEELRATISVGKLPQIRLKSDTE